MDLDGYMTATTLSAIFWPVAWGVVIPLYHVIRYGGGKVVDYVASKGTQLGERLEERRIQRLMWAKPEKLKRLGAEVRKDGYGELYFLSFRNGTFLSFLALEDSTTKEPVRLRVPAVKMDDYRRPKPRFETPQQALSWSFGVGGPGYHPTQQT